MIRVSLTNNQGFSWDCFSGLNLKGYIYLDNKQLTINELYEYLQKNESALDGAIASLNGCFSIVFEKADNIVLVITDKIGLFPIYYEKEGENVYIFDDPNNNHSKQLNYGILERFSYLGSTEKNETLLKNVEVTLPSSMIIFENGKKESTKKYFEWSKGVGKKCFDSDEFEKAITSSI